jgi:Tfp pilus assembly protein PilE
MKEIVGRKAQSGLTLTELVVVCFFLIVVTGLVYATFRYDSQNFARQTSQSATQVTLRIWAVRMDQDIRRACYDASDSSPNAYTITTAAEQDFEFAVNATPSSVGYRLNGTDLELSLSGGTWRPVLQNVTFLDFNYYDAQGTGLLPSDPNFTPTAISEVEVTLIAQPSSGGYPGSPIPVIAEHFRAALRNQC